MHLALLVFFLSSFETARATLLPEKDQIVPRDRGCLRLLTLEPMLDVPKRWDKFMRLVNHQSRAERLRRAILIAIQQAAYDGLQFGRSDIAGGYKFESWFRDVNSFAPIRDRLKADELRLLLNHMARHDIIQFSIPQGKTSLGRPVLAVTREVYDHLVNHADAQRAARVDHEDLRKLWKDIHALSEKIPHDAAQRAGPQLYYLGEDGILRILVGEVSISM